MASAIPCRSRAVAAEWRSASGPVRRGSIAARGWTPDQTGDGAAGRQRTDGASHPQEDMVVIAGRANVRGNSAKRHRRSLGEAAARSHSGLSRPREGDRAPSRCLPTRESRTSPARRAQARAQQDDRAIACARRGGRITRRTDGSMSRGGIARQRGHNPAIPGTAATRAAGQWPPKRPRSGETFGRHSRSSWPGCARAGWPWPR